MLGHRWTVILGGLVSSVAMFVSAFVSEPTALLVLYGVITGKIGFAKGVSVGVDDSDEEAWGRDRYGQYKELMRLSHDESVWRNLN